MGFNGLRKSGTFADEVLCSTPFAPRNAGGGLRAESLKRSTCLRSITPIRHDAGRFGGVPPENNCSDAWVITPRHWRIFAARLLRHAPKPIQGFERLPDLCDTGAQFEIARMGRSQDRHRGTATGFAISRRSDHENTSPRSGRCWVFLLYLLYFGCQCREIWADQEASLVRSAYCTCCEELGLRVHSCSTIWP